MKLTLKYLYLNKRDNPELSLDYEEGEGFSLLEILGAEGSIEEDYLAKERLQALSLALTGLTDIEREVIYSFYIEGKPMGDIAKDRGSSYRTVVNNKTRALRKMKDNLDGKL